MIKKLIAEYNRYPTGVHTQRVVKHYEFFPQRPMLQNSPDKIEFWENDTRYYRINGKTFDANTHDKLMGVGNEKPKMLSKGEERSVERLRYRDGREYIAKKKAAKKRPQ